MTEPAPRYGPPNALVSPRYAGVKTFARCPLVDDPEGVDVAILGIPFDTATTNRPGARFGPEAVRSASIALRPYNPVQDAQVFGALSVADFGDVTVTPGNAERTVGQIAEQLEPIVRSGARTLCIGGDHLVVLGELRAHAAVHGPLGLVLTDEDSDLGAFSQDGKHWGLAGMPAARSVRFTHLSIVVGEESVLMAVQRCDDPGPNAGDGTRCWEGVSGRRVPGTLWRGTLEPPPDPSPP